jgi:hypothetical protein
LSRCICVMGNTVDDDVNMLMYGSTGNVYGLFPLYNAKICSSPTYSREKKKLKFRSLPYMHLH